MSVIYDEPLLTRDQFRESVLARDGGKCVVCGKQATAAHHILERRLWGNGGYYLSNGASVCDEHHIHCEQTIISVEQIREMCGIEKWSIPEHLYADEVYDKWGNIVLPNGQRCRGELMNDESVKKIIVADFTSYVKYPRTYHLPWSQGMNNDDRMISTLDHFIGKRVIVTTKMDGENFTMYQDYCHARSINSGSHPSRNIIKAKWGQIAYEIPQGWRICCENLYAKHSIHYTDLPDLVMGFSVWDDNNVCQNWDMTKFVLEYLDITPVPVLYDGIWDEQEIRSLWHEKMWDTCEGYVVRIADEFSYGQFKNSVAKFVRAGHVQTSKHWMRGQPIVPNKKRP